MVRVRRWCNMQTPFRRCYSRAGPSKTVYRDNDLFDSGWCNGQYRFTYSQTSPKRGNADIIGFLLLDRSQLRRVQRWGIMR